MSGKSSKPRRRAHNPHAAVVDATIVATGRPTRYNRRRLAEARTFASQAATVAIEQLIAELTRPQLPAFTVEVA